MAISYVTILSELVMSTSTSFGKIASVAKICSFVVFASYASTASAFFGPEEEASDQEPPAETASAPSPAAPSQPSEPASPTEAADSEGPDELPDQSGIFSARSSNVGITSGFVDSDELCRDNLLGVLGGPVENQNICSELGTEIREFR